MLIRNNKLIIPSGINISHIVGIIAYLSGMFSSMPIVGINIAGHFLSMFSILFIMLLVGGLLFVISNGKLQDRITKFGVIFFIFLFWSSIGILIGFAFLNTNWHPYLKSNMVKILEYILLLIVMNSVTDKTIPTKFARGLMLGFVLNCLWSVLQGMYYLIFHRSLNNVFFSNSIMNSTEIWTSYGGIRACGFNMDPANIGGLLPAVLLYALYEKKYSLIITCCLSLVFSQSTTALAGAAFVFVVYLIIIRKKRIFKSNTVKKNTKGLYLIGLIIGIIIVLIVCKQTVVMNKIFLGVNNYINGFINRVTTNYVKTDDKGPRSIYYGYALKQLFKRNGLFIIFGSGLGTSMDAYSEYGIFGEVGVTTFGEIEATYLAYLFDCGVFGLGIYVAFLYMLYKELKSWLETTNDKVALIYFAFLLSSIFSEFFYHYIITAYRMTTVVFVILYLRGTCSSSVKLKNFDDDVII